MSYFSQCTLCLAIEKSVLSGEYNYTDLSSALFIFKRSLAEYLVEVTPHL